MILNVRFLYFPALNWTSFTSRTIHISLNLLSILILYFIYLLWFTDTIEEIIINNPNPFNHFNMFNLLFFKIILWLLLFFLNIEMLYYFFINITILIIIGASFSPFTLFISILSKYLLIIMVVDSFYVLSFLWWLCLFFLSLLVMIHVFFDLLEVKMFWALIYK